MSDSWMRSIIARHRSRGIVVDTQILLVYFVGLYNLRLVESFKRTQSFTKSDFIVLRAFLQPFSRIISTPTILAEVNSLANQMEQQNKAGFYAIFKNQVEHLQESYTASRIVCEHRFFPKSGLTDAAIMTIAEEDFLVLTDDFRLTQFLGKLDIDCINFNHVRST